MRKVVLLLSIFLLQMTLQADSPSSKKEIKGKDESAVDQETIETIKSLFGKPELFDVPVPKGFVMLKDSYVHKASSFRYGEIYLSGDLVIDSTEKFYNTQMSRAGWVMGDATKTEKTVFKFTKYTMPFTKDREKIVIHIGKNSLEDKTTVFIDLKPALK